MRNKTSFRVAAATAMVFFSVITVFPGARNAQGAILVLNPTDDAEISKRAPDYHTGSAVQMSLRNAYGGGGTDYWESDILSRFDLSSIPANAAITSATLYLYYWQNIDSYAGGRALNLYRVPSNWNEEDVTWNTRPSKASQRTSYSIVPASPGTWMTWDVTSDVQAFVSGQAFNFGWEIMDENYWGNYNIPMTRFYTKEHRTLIPRLEITVIPSWRAAICEIMVSWPTNVHGSNYGDNCDRNPEPEQSLARIDKSNKGKGPDYEVDEPTPFSIDLFPCQPLPVVVGDSADVRVDADQSGTFDDDERYPAVVTMTRPDRSGAAREISIRILTKETFTETKWFCALLAIGKIPVGDEQGLTLVFGGSTDYTLDEGKSSTVSQQVAKDYGLEANYPNPFNAKTTISYSVSEDCLVTLVVFDILGHRVKTVEEGFRGAGRYKVVWDGTNERGEQVASGMYLYRLTAGEFEKTKKMLLLK